MFGLKTLLNPFERYTEGQLLTVGISAGIAGSLLAYVFNGRFDGVVDLHFLQEVAWHEPFTDNLIVLICLLAPLLLLGKYINSKTRIIDITTAILIARIPFLVLPLFNINGYMQRLAEEITRSVGEGAMNGSTTLEFTLGGMEMVGLIVFAGVSILAVVWSITLLYNGFKTASNAKTISHKVLFALAIIAAEMLSKIVILKMITHS